MKYLNFKFFLYFLILLINQISNVVNTHCQTNFECLDTGCCKDYKCSPSSKCSRINKICYALVGSAGFIFIGITFLVFFFKIKKTRKSILALKKIDDKFYSKRANSNADMFRRLKNKQGINNN